jgi:hypothetical protein
MARRRELDGRRHTPAAKLFLTIHLHGDLQQDPSIPPRAILDFWGIDGAFLRFIVKV